MLLNLEQHKITGVQHFLLVLQVCASGWAVGQLPLFTLQIFFSAKKLISGPIKNFFFSSLPLTTRGGGEFGFSMKFAIFDEISEIHKTETHYPSLHCCVGHTA